MSNPSRKVIVLVASHDTQNALSTWAQAQGFDLASNYDRDPQPVEAFDFHVTLVASANEVSIPETQHMIDPVKVSARGFDTLGQNDDVPVLKLKADGPLAAMRQFFVETYGIEPTFAEFKAHISLSYAWDGTPALDDLQIPPFELVFDQLSIRTLNPSPAKGGAPLLAKSAGAHRLYA